MSAVILASGGATAILVSGLGIGWRLIASGRTSDATAAVAPTRPTRGEARTSRERPASTEVMDPVTPSRLAVDLRRANLPLRPREFRMIQAGTAATALLVGFLRAGVGWHLVVIALIGFFLPALLLRFWRNRRLVAFEGQLSGALTLAANALEGGYSVPQALETVAGNSPAPVAEEFDRAVRELKLGASLEEVLSNMVARVASEDLELVAMSIAINRTVGGNLARVLRGVVATMDERVRLRQELQVATAQARGSTWIVTVLPLAAAGGMFLLAPNYFQPMVSSPAGYVLLGAGGLLILVGNFLVRRTAAIRV